MSIPEAGKKRKPKVSKGRTLARRREVDRERRRWRQEREQRRNRWRRYRFRVQVVRYYRRWRERMSEKEAVAKALERYGSRQPWPFPLSASSIRGWHRRVAAEGRSSLRGQSSRPKTVHSQVTGRRCISAP